MIKVFEAFAGYGSQSMALRRLGIDFEVIGISEIDKYAIQAYMAVHGETPNYGDISKIDWNSVPDFDFLTYSFPCTDISTAGQQKGLAEGSGTRSSLLWECRKAIEAKRPKYLLMENVKNLVSKKFTPYLKEWLRSLERQGYSNYTKVLNAKDFGVPQNRERVFMVSILGEASFHFPKPFTLEKRLKDVLEKDVDESFYLSEKIVKTFLTRNEKNKAKGNGFKFEPTTGDVIASAILTCAGTRPCDNYVYVVGNTNPSGHGMNDKSCMSFIAEPISCAVRGRNPENPSDRKAGIELEQTLELGTGIANCITTVQKDSLVVEPLNIHEDGCCRTIKANYYKVAGSDILDDSDKGARFKATGVIEYTPLCEPKCVAYTRDGKGKVISRRLTDIANTVHRSTGCGGSTDCFVAEPKILGVSVNPMSRKLEFKGHNSIHPLCPTLRAADYKGPHTVWLKEVVETAETLKFIANATRKQDCDVTINPDLSLRPYVKDKAKSGISELQTDYDESIGSTLISARPNSIYGLTTNYRIRKLTPRECFRLMGVSESDIDKIQASGISKTQQYKMAGNSIVVDVLYYIFKKMFVDKSCEDAQLSLF